MWYNDLRPKEKLASQKYGLVFRDNLRVNEADKKRILNQLINLKKGLVAEIPRKEMDTNILLASWNIKEFGHLAERLPESYMYIAETISAFDIVALQEVKSSTFDLHLVMKILGSHWKYIITDITEGRKGNKERFGFLYDSRRVNHSGLSGELVIPEEILKKYPDEAMEDSIQQLKRTPALTSFESGWKSFSIINLHLHPGNSPKDRKIRKKEVQLLMQLIQEKRKREQQQYKENPETHKLLENLIILGDTNLYSNNTDIVELITQQDFKECEGLKGKPTTASLTEIYDRIFLNVNKYFQLQMNKANQENGDVFNIYKYVLRDQDRELYHEYMKLHKNDPSDLIDEKALDKYFHRYWKRNQLSDHLPSWIEIEADSSIGFLESQNRQIKT